MTMNEIQKRIADFVEKYKLSTDISARLLDLVSEVGEVSKEMLKSSDYGRIPFKAGSGWHEEIGDLLFAIICLANESGVDLDESLKKVLRKYEERFRKKGSIDSGN